MNAPNPQTSSLIQRSFSSLGNKNSKMNNKMKTRSRFRSRKLALESLESRKVMAAEIFGTLYEDVDRSGTRTNGENGLAGWTVFLDLNRNDAIDAGEPSALTDGNGDYRIAGIA